MQSIPASELKRRGLAALDKLLGRGPVHIIRNNRPACVVLSEAEYQRLQAQAGAAGPRSAWEVLLAPQSPELARRTREDIDADLAAERGSWEDR